MTTETIPLIKAELGDILSVTSVPSDNISRAFVESSRAAGLR